MDSSINFKPKPLSNKTKRKVMKKLLLTIGIALSSVIGMSSAETPSYPGGDSAMKEYISSNLKYPATALETGVEGVVTVGFVVLPDGTLKDVKVVKMVDPDLEKEAVRLVNGMPAWIPADREGTPVEAPAKVDISFILPE